MNAARLVDIAAVLIMAAAIVVLAWPRTPAPTAIAVPLLLPGDAPGSLHQPGADQVALDARAAAMGEVITIEDLVRLVAALSDPAGSPAAPGLEDLRPLSDAERAELATLLDRARRNRDALLALETQLMGAQGRLDDAARDLAAQLSPEQRRFVQEQRDAVSVGDVETPYWDRAQEGLE